MKNYVVRISLRDKGGFEDEFIKVMQGYDADEVSRMIEDEYNCQGLCGFEIIKQIYGEEAYHIEIKGISMEQ